ncbi:MAG: hypothetical protein C4519_19270 [Desulfobacteraceae bacterium]|nr:MAG: hypothetical protein C4519_19270 [Desulfobacteraceae bacterium]
MKHLSARHCWNIMDCHGKEDCPAYKRPDIPCWEIARELNDYRSIYKVCEDCIVYVSKQKDCCLSSQELEVIMEHKGLCPLEPQSQRISAQF